MYPHTARLGQWDPALVTEPPAPSSAPWTQAVQAIAKGISAVAPAVAQIVRPAPAPAPMYIVGAPPTYTPGMAVQPAGAMQAGLLGAGLPTWGWVALGLVGVGVVGFALLRR